MLACLVNQNSSHGLKLVIHLQCQLIQTRMWVLLDLHHIQTRMWVDLDLHHI